MKIGKTLSFVRITGVFGLLIIAAGCNKKPGGFIDPFEDGKFNLYDQELGNRIEAYNNAVAPNNANSKSGSPALYIDFSSGINKAFAVPGIKDLMTNCFNTVLAQKFEVYKLGSNKVSPLNITNTTELGQRVSDPAQYADIWAPIQSAVEKIVEGNNDALLITDFEEWQKNSEVTNTAFLKIPFSKWLERGNTIHFFIADYKEGTVAKHLYFTIFNCGNPNESSMISKLEAKLGSLTTRFDLANNSYKLRTAYAGEKSGGVFYDVSGKSDNAKNVLDLKGNYINGLNKGNHFEFYPLGVDWKTIAQLHTTYSAQNQFNDFFRKLYIDLSNEDSYTFGDFDVKVSAIKADFENFSKAAEVKKHKPKLTKGNNGESEFAADEKDVFALACYNPDGSLKEQWAYKPEPVTAISEVFIFNKSLFTNTKNQDHKNVEFGVSFDPKFNLKSINDPTGIVKVDIILNIAAPNLSNPKLSKFQWINAKHVPNIALYESIKNTLQELKPANKAIYSYYIKTQQ
ncbi:hypothetical protein [Pedobacter cryoconitis]|uniref:Lipoprotein n=1 Tax=Pedobacter cryoconitis TaxID=188932 RepID=A0A327SUL6_9SPHI|nr:hypothetical protein [Pedobacter cryoconitis]RAJ33026.1 hypothetical protein LY11_01716 [Pedobacter cryoconitis]